jgi:DNA-binding SARP family transcriptional activator
MNNAANLVNFASDAAFALNGDCQLVAWNTRAEALFGYRAQEVFGRYCHQVLRALLPVGQPLCSPDCPAMTSFDRGTPFAARSCLSPHKDGHWMPVALSSMAVPRTANDGESVAMIFVRPLQQISPPEVPPSVLRVSTLGSFGLSVGGHGVPFNRWQRKQALTLLKYLVTNRGRVVHRERLIECLWPEAPAGRGRERLKVTVCSLRRELRNAGVDEEIIGTADEAYFLRPEAVRLDIEAFDDLVREGNGLARRGGVDEALRCYREARDLYRGDYLEEDLYADWCAAERERLREVYLQTLERIANLYAGMGDLDRAAQACRVALTWEPCRESLQRSLMLCLWRQGHRDEALAQYQTCARVLADTLGVEPVPETQRLYYQIQHSQIQDSPRGQPSLLAS